jgi:hypothetical protein
MRRSAASCPRSACLWTAVRHVRCTNMFLQVRVPNEERDYLRFLWYEEGRVVIYRYKVHLFGKCDSPCVLITAIFLQALKYKDKFPEAFETIAKASLVDNMADSRPKKEGMQELIKQLIEFFPRCAMEIQKFIGNTYDLMKELKLELRITDLQDDKTLGEIFEGIKKPTKVKVLGPLWDYVKDVLGFDFLDIECCKSPVTKKKMLQQLHTLFDPMGILIPFLITGKLLVQECWRLG